MKRPFAILMLSFCTVLAALAQVPERTFKVDVHDTAVVDVPLRSGDRVRVETENGQLRLCRRDQEPDREAG